MLFMPMQKKNWSTEIRLNLSVSYFGVKMVNEKESEINGSELYNSLPLKSPKVGLKLSTFWDYYKSEKSEFEIACLLGFL